MSEWRIWLPFPPTANNMFPTVLIKGRMRRVPSAAYRRWQRKALVYLLYARLPLIKEPVVIKLRLVPRDSRSRDIDNYNKPVLDLLVKGRVLPDDNNRHVKSAIPYWDEPSKQSGVEVTIRLAQNVAPVLNAAERRTLNQITRDGYRLVTPAYHPSKSILSLAEKGLIEPVPGLLEDKPQGWRLPTA